MAPTRNSRPMRRPPALSEDRVAQLAASYLARQDRTVAQLGQYLSRKGASPPAIALVLRRFQELGYVDDRAFARRWAEARLQTHPVGPARLRDELLAQGLAEPDVLAVLSELYPRGSEAVVARRVMAEVQRRRRSVSPAKVMAALRGRGFDEDVIEDIMGWAVHDDADDADADER